MKRRQFIEKTGRGLLLGGLAAITGVLVTRRQVSLDTQCSANFQCRNCGKLSRCQLPEAEMERTDG
jgi:hypothetical protein